MSMVNKIFNACLTFVFLLTFFPTSSPGREKKELTFNGDIISAELNEIPLTQVLEQFKREKGICFDGEKSLLQETVSVKFKNLPFENGLRRILSEFNHALIYDEQQKPAGIEIFSKKKNDKLHENATISFNKKSDIFAVDPLEKEQFLDHLDAHPFGEPTKKSSDAAIRQKIERPANQNKKIKTDNPKAAQIFSSQETGEGTSPSAEQPFGEGSISSSTDSSFETNEWNLFSSSEDPFADALDEWHLSEPDEPFANGFREGLLPE